EGGMRDFHVTGCQTCALPICQELHRLAEAHVVGEARTETERAHGDEPVEAALLIRTKRCPERARSAKLLGAAVSQALYQLSHDRSEERRVGKEWRTQRPRARQ